MSIISLLIWILVFALVLGVIVWIIRLIPLPAPFGNIAIAIVALIALLILIDQLLPLSAVHGPLLR